MQKSFLALFRSREEADAVIEQLASEGLSLEKMKIFTLIGNLRGGYQQATRGTDPNDRYADMKSELFLHLTNWGVPKDESFFFTEGVRRGEKLVIVFAEGKDEKKIANIFRDNGALDLTSRKMYSDELRHVPEQGISGSPFTTISQESSYEEDLAQWSKAHEQEIGPEIKIKSFALPDPQENKQLEKNLNE